MPLENGDRVLLVRIDERLSALHNDFELFRHTVVTKDQCAIAQHAHDQRGIIARAETAARIAALLSVAVAVLWAVLKHA